MKVRKMAFCAMMATVLALCGWLALPFGDGAFTLQTFGVFLALGLLGGKWGCAAIVVYLAMGCVGLPVFTGFRGGIGILFGPTGGYLLGFLFAGLIYWGITAKFSGQWASLLAMALGLVGCYAFGTVWYWQFYLTPGISGLGSALSLCVAPYLLPDCLKLTLAFLLTRRLKRFVY